MRLREPVDLGGGHRSAEHAAEVVLHDALAQRQQAEPHAAGGILH